MSAARPAIDLRAERRRSARCARRPGGGRAARSRRSSRSSCQAPRASSRSAATRSAERAEAARIGEVALRDLPCRAGRPVERAAAPAARGARRSRRARRACSGGRRSPQRASGLCSTISIGAGPATGAARARGAPTASASTRLAQRVEVGAEEAARERARAACSTSTGGTRWNGPSIDDAAHRLVERRARAASRAPRCREHGARDAARPRPLERGSSKRRLAELRVRLRLRRSPCSGPLPREAGLQDAPAQLGEIDAAPRAPPSAPGCGSVMPGAVFTSRSSGVPSVAHQSRRGPSRGSRRARRPRAPACCSAASAGAGRPQGR